jgi:hypothetical protein
MNIADWEANSSHVPWAGNDVFVVATSLAARVNNRQNFTAHSPNGPVAVPAVDRRVAEVFCIYREVRVALVFWLGMTHQTFLHTTPGTTLSEELLMV